LADPLGLDPSDSPARHSIEPIDWSVAAKVASRLSGSDPFARSYHGDSLVTDFARLTPQAEALVTQSTGLIPDGPARARVVSRPEWIQANIKSFQRMLRPITDRMASQMTGPFAPAARVAAGVEIGTMLGVLSKRVLGQYDLLAADDDDHTHQDVVSYVGPNVLALEKKFSFPPQEFRLWLALHEVTHRAQFTGVPWMRDYFLGLTNRTLGGAEPDPRRLLIALKRSVDAVRAGRSPFEDGGIAALLADDDQRDALDSMGGLMSLLEGHGDITMDRAGVGHIPSAGRFSATLRNRRNQTAGVAKFVQQVTGFEAKLRQYEEGERFIEAIEQQRSMAFLDKVWVSQDRVPTLAEIRAPGDWITRIESLERVTVATPTPTLRRRLWRR
jgi:coenzyme F420 biosynthesis associated uncharacterized protein